MLAPVIAGPPITVRRNGTACVVLQSIVFTHTWLYMRRHVDLLRLASAMCRAA